MQELRALFLEFQERWSLERVKNMTLEEYTGIGGETRDDFTYWIEKKLDKLGSIWGGSSFKFGIYKRADNKEKKDDSTHKYSKEYAWYRMYGETEEEAFEKIKSIIVEVIEFSQQNKLDKIEEVYSRDRANRLGHSYKWKIAFHYQNIDNIKITCIFNWGVLKAIAKGESLGENLSTAQIYQKLLGDKIYTLETMINEKSKPLYAKYGRNESIADDEEEEMDEKDAIRVIPLNQILYGPPGTGKTYQTIDRALEILGFSKKDQQDLDYDKIKTECESLKILLNNNSQDRAYAKALFDYFKEEGQIEFITFHQSFSYEEFVEGIKPKIDESSQMTYEVQNGIFKKICKKVENVSLDSNKTLWRLYTIPDGTPKSDFFQECIEKEQVWVFKQDSNGNIENDNIKGDYLVIPTASKGMSQTIRAFGVFGDFIEEKEGKLYRKVKWLWKDASQEGVPIPEANFARNTFQRVEKAKDEILQCIKKALELKPYILIIDEINRGNISKILGELITLIEPSKRIGEDEALEVTLPYSQESFGVPNNLYIIGTMNTADRSIALLDTALRRRFEFIEMMPQPNLLQDCAGVNLQELLKTINHRIEFLLDREHTIGHAYFIGVETLEKLQAVFTKKIIPLLQEYFYEDYAKIDAVLNGNKMIESHPIKDLGDFVDTEKKIYRITDSSKWDIKTFQNIYNNTVQDR